MNYSSMKQYYETMFLMWNRHGMPVSEYERMLPYERDLLIEMIEAKEAADANYNRLLDKQRALNAADAARY